MAVIVSWTSEALLLFSKYSLSKLNTQREIQSNFPAGACTEERDCVLIICIYMAESASGQDEIMWSDWLSKRERWTHLACSGFPALVTQEKVLVKLDNIFLCETKLVWSRWLTVALVFFAFLLTSASSRPINTQKRSLGNIQPSYQNKPGQKRMHNFATKLNFNYFRNEFVFTDRVPDPFWYWEVVHFAFCNRERSFSWSVG